MSIKMEVHGQMIDVNRKEIRDHLESIGLVQIEEGINAGVDITESLDAIEDFLFDNEDLI